MALLFMDGFDTGDYAQRWTTAIQSAANPPVLGLATGRFGSGQAVTIRSSHTSFTGGLVRTYLSGSATIRVGVAVNVPGPTASDFPLIAFPAFGGSLGNIVLKFTSAGSLLLVKQSSTYDMWQFSTGTTSLATASDGLTPGQWSYLEIEYLPASSPTGRFILRKNGIVILDYTGDTRSSTSITKPEMVALFGGFSSGPTVSFDDLYIADTTGTQNNTFLGDVEVRALAPSGNGTYSQFVGSDGDSVNNYAIINNTTYTDYVESSTVGQKDSYQLPDLSGVNVKAVQSVVRGAQVSGGMAAVRPFVRIGSTDYPGTTQYLGQQTVSTNIFEINPATSTTWTQTDVNGAEVGIEVV